MASESRKTAAGDYFPSPEYLSHLELLNEGSLQIETTIDAAQVWFLVGF